MRFAAATTICLCLLLGLIGCDRQSESASTQPTAAAPGMVESELIGKWKVTTVEGSPDLAQGVIDDLKTSTLDLHADHTFRAKNNTYGGYSGSWAVSGPVVTLLTSKDESPLLPAADTLIIEGKRLAKRGDLLSSIYEQVPNDIGVTPFKLTAGQYLAEFKNNSAGFKRKYHGNIVEIDGVVNKVITTSGQGSYVLVYGPPESGSTTEPDMMEGVACFTIDKQPYLHLAYGQTVTIRGEAGDMTSTPQLLEAEVISAGPPTAITITTSQLAGEFTKDHHGMAKKYTAGKLTGKTLILSGPLLATKPDAAGDPTGLFLGSDNAKVLCDFGSERAVVARLRALKVGEPIILVGEYDMLPTNEKYPTVNQCRLVAEK